MRELSRLEELITQITEGQVKSQFELVIQHCWENIGEQMQVPLAELNGDYEVLDGKTGEQIVDFNEWIKS